MQVAKADIIAQLQKDILPLQGFKCGGNNTAIDTGLGAIKNAFPGKTFPLGAIHEFIYDGSEDIAVTDGFIAGILSSLMRTGGASIWIGATKNIYPPALLSFGIQPDKIIFLDLKKEKEILWAVEESLKCEGLAAVIGELQNLSFATSRRLQLAVEQSRVTGFIIRKQTRNINTTACVTRWKITGLPSALEDGMPGVGFPRWNVELLKVRNGQPGSWEIEFTGGRFRHLYKVVSITQALKKTG
jgi:protein ImuA